MYNRIQWWERFYIDKGFAFLELDRKRKNLGIGIYNRNS